jgi:prepilin-type N-terminal cleavage/methylation domain-containing protein
MLGFSPGTQIPFAPGMRTHARRPADRGGYTMIEMLTVLVLILILASMAAPAMNSYVSHTKSRRALDRVANDIAFARMAAVREGRRATVDFGAAGSSVYTIELQGRASPVRTVNLGREYRGVAITPPTAARTLVFDSRGLLLSPDPGTIVVRVAGAADSALLTTAGRVYRAY